MTSSRDPKSVAGKRKRLSLKRETVKELDAGKGEPGELGDDQLDGARV